LPAHPGHAASRERTTACDDEAHVLPHQHGAIVDQRALDDALMQGRLAGAGLDVLDPEPPPEDARILGFPNVILAPHALCWTDQCFAAIGEGCIPSMQALARGGGRAVSIPRSLCAE